MTQNSKISYAPPTSVVLTIHARELLMKINPKVYGYLTWAEPPGTSPVNYANTVTGQGSTLFPELWTSQL